MAKAVQKITLSPSRDIPFNKLVLSQSNVRRVKAGISIEQLAESIAQRTLLQSLNVRAVLDADGNETGTFEVPAGGRRYRALELLVKQKRMAKTQLVPCVVREGGVAEDDSIAENDERVNASWPPYEAALKEAKATFQAYTYPGTQHGFNNDTTPRYDEAAAKLAWGRTMEFFGKYVKG